MAVRLRLRRVGRKKAPIYKVVAADARSPRDGRYIESVGQYEPLRQTNNVEFKEDRVMYWLQNGAQPTDTVRNLLSSKGLWLKWSLLKKGADENVITEQLDKFAAQRAEKEQRAKDKAAEKKKKKAAPDAQEKVEEQPAAAETTPAPEPAEETESAEGAETQETPKDEVKSQEEPVNDAAQEKQPEAKPEEKAEEKPEEKAEDTDSDKKE